MRQSKFLILALVACSLLVLTSCVGVGQPASGWSGPAVQDGIIYVASRAGGVVAVNSSNGDELWFYAMVTTSGGGLACGPTSTPTAIYATPIVDGDLVYVATYSGQVLALSTLARSQSLTFPQQRYGEWEWNCPLDGAKSTAIVADLVVDGNALYAASSNGRVYSLDKQSGDENWNRENTSVLAEKLWTSPAIQGDTLYVSTFDGHVYALSAETGELLDWSFQSEVGFASSPVVYGNTMFLGSFDRYLHAIEIGSNASKWRFPAEEPAGNWFWASPIVNEGIVYAACLDGSLYAIEAETGEELWKFGSESSMVSSPVLMDNLLIVIDDSGTVHIFDISTEFGSQAVPVKAISVGASVKSSFYAEDGLVYTRGEDNWLYIVDIDRGAVSWKFDLGEKEE